MKGYGGHVQSSRENTAPRLLMTALQTHSDELNWARRRPFHDGTSHEKFDVWPRLLSSNLYRGKRFSNHVRMRTIQSRKPVKTSEKKHEKLTRKFQWNPVPLPASSFGTLSHTGIKRRLSTNFLEARVKRKDQQRRSLQLPSNRSIETRHHPTKRGKLFHNICSPLPMLCLPAGKINSLNSSPS